MALIVSGILVGLYAAFLILRGRPLPSHGVNLRFDIASGTSETDPNILAASLLVPMVLSVERLLLGGSRWWRSQTWRILGGLGAFFSFLAIVFSRDGRLLVLSRQVEAAKMHRLALIKAPFLWHLGVQ